MNQTMRQPEPAFARYLGLPIVAQSLRESRTDPAPLRRAVSGAGPGLSQTLGAFR